MYQIKKGLFGKKLVNSTGTVFSLKKYKYVNENLNLKSSEKGYVFVMNDKVISPEFIGIDFDNDTNCICKTSSNEYFKINLKTSDITPNYVFEIKDNQAYDKTPYLVDKHGKLIEYNPSTLKHKETNIVLHDNEPIILAGNRCFIARQEDKYTIMTASGSLVAPFIFDSPNISMNNIFKYFGSKQLDGNFITLKQGDKHVAVWNGRILNEFAPDAEPENVSKGNHKFAVICDYDKNTDKSKLYIYNVNHGMDYYNEINITKNSEKVYDGKVMFMTDTNSEKIEDELIVVQRMVDGVKKCGIINSNNVEVVPVVYDEISLLNKNEMLLKRGNNNFYFNIQTGEMIDENTKQEEVKIEQANRQTIKIKQQQKEFAYQQWLGQKERREYYDRMTDSTQIVVKTRREFLEIEKDIYNQQNIGNDGTGFDRHFIVNYMSEDPEKKYRRKFEQQYNQAEMGDDNK